MKRFKSVATIFCKICVVLLAIGVVLLTVFAIKKDRKAQTQYNSDILQIRSKQEELTKQKDELTQELKKVKSEYNIHMVGTATCEIALFGLNRNYYTEIFPIMQKYNYKGVLILSDSDLPDMAGKMSTKEFNSMLSSGWEYCVAWDGISDVDKYFADLDKKLKSLKIAFPQTVYFSTDSYSDKYLDILSKYNVKIILHGGDNNMSMHGKYSKDGIWYPAYRSWNYTGVKSDIDYLIEMGGNYALLFKQTSDIAEKTVSSFENMLDYISKFNKDQLIVTGFNEASKMYYKKVEDTKQLDSDLEAKMDKLSKEIKVLEKKISNVYTNE